MHMYQKAAALQCNSKSHCQVITIAVDIGSYQNDLLLSRSLSLLNFH